MQVKTLEKTMLVCLCALALACSSEDGRGGGADYVELASWGEIQDVDAHASEADAEASEATDTPEPPSPEPNETLDMDLDGDTASDLSEATETLGQDSAEESKEVLKPETGTEIETAAPDLAEAFDGESAEATSVAALTFSWASDMRYFAGPEDCDESFHVPLTTPSHQDHVWLTGSWLGWPEDPGAGAIALTKGADGWDADVHFDGAALGEDGMIAYKYLMKWPDGDTQWCVLLDDGTPHCASADENMQRHVPCGAASYDSSSYYRGALEALALKDPGAFLISAGDLDPPWAVAWTHADVLGSAVHWIPVVGNHELEDPANMQWLREWNPGGDALPYVVRAGPPGGVETTYSMRSEGVHVAVINQYYDGASDDALDGDVGDALYEWLATDLAQAAADPTVRAIFVTGHEPAFPQPDADNGRLRHEDDSLNKYPDKRDRFWTLLAEQGVVAYLCGHTHNYSAVEIDGVWQVDTGHARGAGDTGAPSTIGSIRVEDSAVTLEVWRDTHDGVYDYADIHHEVILKTF